MLAAADQATIAVLSFMKSPFTSHELNSFSDND
jgi:hypothetical protein